MKLKFLVLSVSILTMIGCQSTPSPRTTESATNADHFPAQGPSTNSTDDEALRSLAATALADGDFSTSQQYLLALQQREPADYLALAQSCQGLADFQCAADGFIQASTQLGLGHPQLPTDINDLIWRSLNRAERGPLVFSHRYHHAWWLLQQKFRDANNISDQVAIWRQWQQDYPSHPARLQPPSALLRLEDYSPPKIAVFLPTSGPYKGVGQAIRDGLVSAHLEQTSSQRSQIKFYDSHQYDIATLWEQALVDGAEVTIGPLLKQNAQKFAQLSQYSNTPRLTLNYLDTNIPSDSLYQLGISIEDEAGALASHVLLTGLERVLVVHSAQRWSSRAYEEFKAQWPYPVHTAQFSDIKTLTTAIGTAMQVEASDQRKTAIQRIIGTELEFLPRARGDLDAVVALTDQVESLALVPALRFHFASKLPVFATSQAARGNQLAGLKNFLITEMPLYLDANTAQNNLRQAFNLDKLTQQAELYALGVDAYRVAAWLPVIDQQSQATITGASGYLWLDTQGKFKRDLNLGKVTAQGTVAPLPE